jgi:hypothetical protein
MCGRSRRFWAQHHFGIWRSADNAKSWQQATAQPSSFGFGLVVHPDTAWPAPGIKDEKRCPVDGSRSFDALSKGLPQANANDTVFRHALAVDETGERLYV